MTERIWLTIKCAGRVSIENPSWKLARARWWYRLWRWCTPSLVHTWTFIKKD